MRLPSARRAVIALACALVVVAGLLASTLGHGPAEARATPAASPGAIASGDGSTRGDAAVQHLKFEYGPLEIKPGQNVIETNTDAIPQPSESGWVVGFKPSLRLANGKVPAVDVVHLHHGVWANGFRRDATAPLFPERFIAAGEEKTALDLPDGYGYPYRVGDFWYLNYMIHNLTAKPFTVSITYDVDFVPTTAPTASAMKDVRPVWLDVQNGNLYPVFDVHKGSGTDGKYTYPDDEPGAPRVNTYTLPNDAVLVKAFGHLHPGGLYDTFSVTRGDQTTTVFTSKAKYYEPAGAVSWDVSMSATPDDWEVAVEAGDTLGISATYDSSRASWYESMGLGVVWVYDGPGGTDPFSAKINQKGVLTHGHLRENDNHGGRRTRSADPRRAASGPLTANIGIGSFEYAAGDLGTAGKVPTVSKGETIRFDNFDAADQQVWHSITACKAPCTRSTGIAYPLADADVQFDSGQLGTGGPPTAGTTAWSTPNDLDPGTYTYFCRVHPFMRGAFRVVPPAG